MYLNCGVHMRHMRRVCVCVYRLLVIIANRLKGLSRASARAKYVWCFTIVRWYFQRRFSSVPSLRYNILRCLCKILQIPYAQYTMHIHQMHISQMRRKRRKKKRRNTHTHEHGQRCCDNNGINTGRFFDDRHSIVWQPREYKNI